MGLRTFTDPDGNEWRVWDVVPYAARKDERRGGSDRRQAASGAYAGPERRSGMDRRLRSPSLLTPGLEGGWLCFENHVDKRRLTPIPRDWERINDDALCELLHRARSVQRRGGLAPG